MLTFSRTFGAIARPTAQRYFSTETDLLEKLLKEAKKRESAESSEAATADESTGEKFAIGTFNAISPSGLAKFSNKYNIHPMESSADKETHGILLRSYKIKSEEVSNDVRAIARCGAGTNNIPVGEMTERGIPVFNTPGANANAVKELVICGLFLASRGIVEGIGHVKTIFAEDGNDVAKVKKRVESEKKLFVGKELYGKKIGVIGLGHIGASVATTALDLGMEVVGYDPSISLDAAWRLPNSVGRADDVSDLYSCDYISLHVPYMEATHHLISADVLKNLKPNCHVVNFARGELVDSAAMRELYDQEERTGKYIADFADEWLHDHPKVVLMPHLGASTAEAEENSAGMAAEEMMDFIETGCIRNSVNFPTTQLDRIGDHARICIVNKNVPGMLGLITSTLGASGLNIVQQINTSRGDIAYTVVDLDSMPAEETLVKCQAEVSKLDGVISSRVIEPSVQPGFFLVNEL